MPVLNFCKVEKDAAQHKVSMTLFDFAGTDDLESALLMWQAEREAMLRLHDANTAMQIHDRRMRLVFALCSRVFEALAGQMFLPPGVAQKIAKAREQMKIMERHVADRELVEMR